MGKKESKKVKPANIEYSVLVSDSIVVRGLHCAGVVETISHVTTTNNNDISSILMWTIEAFSGRTRYVPF